MGNDLAGIFVLIIIAVIAGISKIVEQFQASQRAKRQDDPRIRQEQPQVVPGGHYDEEAEDDEPQLRRETTGEQWTAKGREVIETLLGADLGEGEWRPVSPQAPREMPRPVEVPVEAQEVEPPRPVVRPAQPRVEAPPPPLPQRQPTQQTKRPPRRPKLAPSRQRVAGSVEKAHRHRGVDVRKLLGTSKDVRRVIVAAEILGPPLAMRKDGGPSSAQL